MLRFLFWTYSQVIYLVRVPSILLDLMPELVICYSLSCCFQVTVSIVENGCVSLCVYYHFGNSEFMCHRTLIMTTVSSKCGITKVIITSHYNVFVMNLRIYSSCMSLVSGVENCQLI